MVRFEVLYVFVKEGGTVKVRSHLVRSKDEGTARIEKYTRGKAIKLFCTECMGFSSTSVDECNSPLCPLYPFRGASRAAYKSTEGDGKEMVSDEQD